MFWRVFSTLLLTVALATPIAASGPGENHAAGTGYLPDGKIPYELFESTITHSDLEGCPKNFDTDVVFCRMTMANDLAHVFVFFLEGDQDLVAVKSYELTDGFLPF